MDLALLVARLLLAAVFLVAGVAKLADKRGSVQAMRDFGVPARLATPFGLILPVFEIVIALALLPVATAWWGAIGALGLLLTFVGGIAYNMAHGKQPDCHCFGQLHSRPAGWTTLIRNSVLSAVAAFVIIGGWDDTGASTVAWIADLTGFERALVLGGAVLLVVVAVESWLLLHLLQQNGRILVRLDALEGAVRSGAPIDHPPVANGQPVTGLPVGTPAPGFSLPNLAGHPVTLDDLRAADGRTLLLFSDPGCGPCNALMAEVGQWQQEHAGSVTIVVVSRGDLEANRSKAGEHGVRNVVLQQDREVAEAYQVQGTPSAVMIRPDGAIGSTVAVGADTIRHLVTLLTTTRTTSAPMSTENGNGNAPAHGDMVGTPVPAFTLATLDGEEAALSTVIAGEPTVLLFWNPGCGFCARMLDNLKAHEAGPPEGAPRIVVISSGDAERNRAEGFRSTVLLDDGFSAGRHLGATGTPSAVLIDAAGRIASPVAVGAPAVLALAGAREERVAGRVD